MIYQSKPRMQLDDIFGAFDCPDAGQIAPRRTSSTTPLQALNLLNSPFALQLAACFAERLKNDAGTDVAAQVRRSLPARSSDASRTVEESAAVNDAHRASTGSRSFAARSSTPTSLSMSY